MHLRLPLRLPPPRLVPFLNNLQKQQLLLSKTSILKSPLLNLKRLQLLLRLRPLPLLPRLLHLKLKLNR